MEAVDAGGQEEFREIMVRQEGTVYGIQTYREWPERVAANTWRNLSDTKRTADEIAAADPYPVHSFRELVEVVSFLSVMNKELTLLFRGQGLDATPVASMHREKWTTGDGLVTEPTKDPAYYSQQLTALERRIERMLLARGIPRWRPFRYHREARWSIIQHYELWPTPLLDLTSSMRVAASFAFGQDPRSPRGFFYVFGVKHLRSDLMARSPSESGMVAIRLSAVCPPEASRPHLQEAFLFGPQAKEGEHQTVPSRGDAIHHLVAKLLLRNEKSQFWDEEFPMLTRATLLPEAKDDALLRDLKSCAEPQPTS